MKKRRRPPRDLRLQVARKIAARRAAKKRTSLAAASVALGKIFDVKKNKKR